MNLKKLIYVLILIDLLSGVAFADSVRRYKNNEIRTLYQSSRFYFDRGDYQKAIKILKNIPPHQHTAVQTHIEVLRIINRWSSSFYTNQLDSLSKLGVNKNKLFEVSCDWALNNHQYSMYSICAKNCDSFVDEVDRQILSMLQDYYTHRNKPFHAFTWLAALVNKDELTLSYDEDAELLRERIRAVLTGKNCETDTQYCSLPVISIRPVIRDFVYGPAPNE